MEVLQNKVEYKYGAEELHQEMKELISEINNFIAENDCHVSEESKKALKEYKGIIWKSYFGNKSKNMRKKFNQYLRKFRLKESRHSANLLLHFIHTRVIANVKESTFWGVTYKSFNSPDWIKKIKIEAPLKHQAIQAKRKKWKEAQAIADQLYSEYREEKGNYYKQ